ncbi:hypothetical protein ACVW0J_001871 [Bradyrhizobium sp. i1.7.7]
MGTLPYNPTASADNNGLWISLINGGGGPAGDLKVDVNLTQPAGIQLRCGYNVEFRGEYELTTSLTGAGLLDLNGADCTISGVRVHAQMQATGAAGTPRLLNIASNCSSIVLSESNIATPSAYTPVVNTCPSFQLGPNYWSVGGAAHIGGTAAANTYGGG